MKLCQVCQRVYLDDAQIFCLDDGATLVANNAGTLHMREARATNPAATEVFTAAPNGPLFTPSVSVPPIFHPSVSPVQNKSKPAFILGILAILSAITATLVVAVGIVGAAADWNSSAVGGLIVSTMFIALFGAVAGLVGILLAVRGSARKIVPILGFLGNAAYLLFIIALLVLGIAASK